MGPYTTSYELGGRYHFPRLTEASGNFETGAAQ